MINVDNYELQILMSKGTPVIDIREKFEWKETGILPASHLITFFDSEGKYDVDMQQLIVDYAFMQLQDFLIGKMSQGIVSQAIDTGGWQSPIGPEAFVNKMFDNEALKDYQVDNSWIKSQFEKGMNYVSTPRQ